VSGQVDRGSIPGMMGKMGDIHVDIPMVKRLEDGLDHAGLEDSEVEDHASTGVDGTLHNDGDGVVVPVARGVVAATIDRLVLLIGEVGRVEAVGGREGL
jgi:hypothetical protein